MKVNETYEERNILKKHTKLESKIILIMKTIKSCSPTTRKNPNEMEPAAGQDKRARDNLFAISYEAYLDQVIYNMLRSWGEHGFFELLAIQRTPMLDENNFGLWKVCMK